MNESELGVPWDVSWEPEAQTDVIMLDAGEDVIYLTVSDLKEMLDALS